MAEQIGEVSVGVEVETKGAERAVGDLSKAFRKLGEGVSKMGSIMNAGAAGFRLLARNAEGTNKELAASYQRMSDLFGQGGLMLMGVGHLASMAGKLKDLKGSFKTLGASMLPVLGTIAAISVALLGVVAAVGAAKNALDGKGGSGNLLEDFKNSLSSGMDALGLNTLLDKFKDIGGGGDPEMELVPVTDGGGGGGRSRATPDHDYDFGADPDAPGLENQDIANGFDSFIGEMKEIDLARAKETADKLDSQMSATSDTFEGMATQMSGPFATTLNTFQKTLAETGDIYTAMIAAVVVVLMKTEGFGKIMDGLNLLLADLIDALEPLVSAILPVLSVVFKVLGDLFKVLGDLLEELAPVLELVITYMVGPFLGVFVRMATALTYAVAAVTKAVEAVKDFLKPLEKLGEIFGKVKGKIEGVINKIKGAFGFGGGGGKPRFLKMIEKIQDSIAKEAPPLAMAFINLTEVVKETAKQFSESLTNIPTGIKIALARFDASSAVSAGGLGAGTINIGEVTIKSDNPDVIWAGLKKVIERENNNNSGTPVGLSPRYASR